MKKKTVLIFIDWFLPGYKAGGPIRSVANLITHLRNDFKFLVITRNTDYCETIPYKEIQSDQWNILPDGIRVYYFSKKNLKRTNIKKVIAHEQFDYVYLNGIYSLYFSLLTLLILKRKGLEIIVAARGMLAESALSVKKIKKLLFLCLAKTFGLFDNVVFHAVTPSEAGDILKQFGKNAKVKIAPNLHDKFIDNGILVRTKEKQYLKLVNIARISPEKNLKFALEILTKAGSNIVFDIYGSIYNRNYWKDCLSLINKMPPNIRVNYKETIENDKVYGLFQQYHFMFMPTTGENFGHVIFESLAAGCPVIISDKTPWRNLTAQKAGWDISLSGSESFVNVINFAAGMNQAEYDIWSESAILLAKKAIDNPETIEMNKNLFR